MRKHYKLRRRNIFIKNRSTRSYDWFALVVLILLGCVSLIFMYSTGKDETDPPPAQYNRTALQAAEDRSLPKESYSPPKIEPEPKPAERATPSKKAEPAKIAIVQNGASSPATGTDLKPDTVETPQDQLCTVEGKVVDPDGTPLSGVAVHIQNGQSAVTDRDGRYTIRDVPAGKYIVRAFGEGDASKETKVEVSYAETNVEDIVLLKPVKMVFCKDIQKNVSDTGVKYTLFGIDTEFPDETDRVICFTKIVGAPDDTVIAHRWFWEDQLQSQVLLEVKSRSWRTYSSKNILPNQQGTWRVDVTEAFTETLLASSTFVVR